MICTAKDHFVATVKSPVVSDKVLLDIPQKEALVLIAVHSPEDTRCYTESWFIRVVQQYIEIITQVQHRNCNIWLDQNTNVIPVTDILTPCHDTGYPQVTGEEDVG